MIDYRKAQKILINSKINIKNEIIFANDSINRISAQNIYSPTNYPAGNNTAFDGYAINSQETNRLSDKNIKKFKISLFSPIRPMLADRVQSEKDVI